MVDNSFRMLTVPGISESVPNTIDSITNTAWSGNRELRTAFFPSAAGAPPKKENLVAMLYLSAENDTSGETTEARIINAGNNEVLLSTSVTGSGFKVSVVGPIQVPEGFYESPGVQRVTIEYRVSGGTGTIYDGTTLVIGPGVEQD